MTIVYDFLCNRYRVEGRALWSIEARYAASSKLRPPTSVPCLPFSSQKCFEADFFTSKIWESYSIIDASSSSSLSVFHVLRTIIIPSALLCILN